MVRGELQLDPKELKEEALRSLWRALDEVTLTLALSLTLTLTLALAQP